MHPTTKHVMPLLLIFFFAFSLFELGVLTDHADARSRGGGRSFKQSRSASPAPARTPPAAKSAQQPSSGGFMRGMAGGLVGGAIGSMLFGSLAHAGAGGGLGGSGIGLFQILILGGIGYFIYSRFFKKKALSYAQYQQQSVSSPGAYTHSGSSTSYPPPPPFGGTLEDGLAMIRSSEPDFDPEHFKEIAQDVFFQVQAGWMRRDIKSYQHLLDTKLANEYEQHFTEMRQKGQINKLENIAVRSVEMVEAGTDGNEEFVSLLFKANLLDYTVDENSGAVVEGSMTDPVKFAEQWTWTRLPGEVDWKLAGIDIKSA